MPPLFSVVDLKVHFSTPRREVRAVDGVSFDLQPGETLGLVGESGCGKSTLGKAIIRILEPTSGAIILKGEDISRLGLRQLQPYRPVVQMIFQDPFASLNPRKSIRQILTEPLNIQKTGSRKEKAERVAWLVDKVGLGIDLLDRYPHEFSGGQRQRIGIARALALDPELIICDEPVSALDVSVQAQVINLLKDLQKELSLALIFISHDLSVVQYVADRIAVMYLGKIVEMAPKAKLWKKPLHPFSRNLLSSVLIPDPTVAGQRSEVVAEKQDRSETSQGCSYQTRCAYASDICGRVEPTLEAIDQDRQIACHEIKSLL